MRSGNLFLRRCFEAAKVHSSSSKKVKAPPRSEFVVSMSIFVAITSMILAFDPEKRELVMKLSLK